MTRREGDEPAGPTVEAFVIGRNDGYEPDWTDRLHASLTYNHGLLAEHGVQLSVAFIEWNPPAGAPLLAPDLVARYAFVRGIVADRRIHAVRCRCEALTVLLNLPYNAALRTSAADFTLITSGDLFWSRSLAERVAAGLRPGLLYRAERVNVASSFDLAEPRARDIEDPARVTRVDVCTEPPFDRAPYTNACGDFLLMDRATMTGVRGFDEAVMGARIHLDSRFAWTAMHVVDGCELLGRIFHLDHARSLGRMGASYPGAYYDPSARLPYLNDDDWGLADLHWSRLDDRLLAVSLEPGALGGEPFAAIPEHLDGAARARSQAVRAALVDRRAEQAAEAERLARRYLDGDDPDAVLDDTGESALAEVLDAVARADSDRAVLLADCAWDRQLAAPSCLLFAAELGTRLDASAAARWSIRARSLGRHELSPLTRIAHAAERPLDRLRAAAISCLVHQGDDDRDRLAAVTADVPDADLEAGLVDVFSIAPEAVDPFVTAAAITPVRALLLAAALHEHGAVDGALRVAAHGVHLAGGDEGQLASAFSALRPGTVQALIDGLVT